MQKSLHLVVIMGCLTISTGLRAAEVTRWSFEEDMGTSTADSVGGFNGTLTGGPTWINTGLAPVPSGTSAALSFDGTNDFVNTAYPGIGGSAARTVSFWVRTTDTADHGIVSYGDDTTNGAKWHVRLNSNAANGTLGAIRTEAQGGNSIGVSEIADGNWHHVVSVFGGTNNTDVVHYVDGRREIASGSTAQAVNTNNSSVGNSQPVTIGKRLQAGTNRFLTGSLDEVRIYDTALSAAEIRQLFNGTTLPQAAWNWNGGNAPVGGEWLETHQLIAPGDFDWQLDPGVTHDPNPVTGRQNITGAYSFDGTGGATTVENLQDSPGDPSVNNFSFEVWFRPDGTPGQQVLLEAGGTTVGSSLTLDGNTLQFRVKDGGNVQTLTGDLSVLGSDFIQAVGVIDLANGGDLSLYLNGQLFDSADDTGVADWAGNNTVGLGTAGGAIGGDNGDLAGFGNFIGDIGLVNFFTEALTAEDVRAQFFAVAAPEPGSIFAWCLVGLIGFVGAAWGVRRRQGQAA